ncbi:hypothetical protein FRB91_001947 [Serendipita sp. 411]|nr:hypothetical protein FRC18_008943 [Serendipita sp. 400]KAG8845238.1 hypothetical protein FRB91_001947 [Serendipita sp. 411]
MDVPFDILFLNYRLQREILLKNAPCSRTRDSVSRLLDEPALTMMDLNIPGELVEKDEISLKDDEEAYKCFEILMQYDPDWTSRYLSLAVPVVVLFVADILEKPILQEIVNTVKSEGLSAVEWAYKAQAAALDPIAAIEFLANERYLFPGGGVIRGIFNAPVSLAIGATVAVGFLAYKVATEPSRKEKLQTRLNELLRDDTARHAFWKEVRL